MATYAWISPQGEWLTFRECTTHTGTHKKLGTTSKLSEAFVGTTIPNFNEREGVMVETFTAIPATVLTVRTVTLGSSE